MHLQAVHDTDLSHVLEVTHVVLNITVVLDQTFSNGTCCRGAGVFDIGADNLSPFPTPLDDSRLVTSGIYGK